MKAPEGMYWGRCKTCAPGYDRKAIPNGCDICRDCIYERVSDDRKHKESKGTYVDLYRRTIEQ